VDEEENLNTTPAKHKNGSTNKVAINQILRLLIDRARGVELKKLGNIVEVSDEVALLIF
jgi:hypothetical protein